MKLYKDGKCIKKIDKEQVQIFLDAGWKKTKPVVKAEVKAEEKAEEKVPEQEDETEDEETADLLLRKPKIKIPRKK